MTVNETSYKGYKGKTLARLISSAKAARSDFDKTADTIAKYDKGGPDEMYQNWDTCLSFKSKVFKTQQYKREVGSRLYKDNPQFNVTPKRMDVSLSIERTKLIQTYLNEVVKENSFFRNARSCINHALSHGLGVMWFGVHPDKGGVVTAIADSPRNLLIDPDAKTEDQIKWIGRKRQRPRYALVQELPSKREAIFNLPGMSKRSDVDYNGNGGHGAELIEYYEIYSTVGIHHYRGGVDYSSLKGQTKFRDIPKKYIVTENGIILDESDWEVPYHLDGSWPCEWLYFYEDENSIWPCSPLEPGIGFMEAYNWVATLLVAKFQWSSKTVIAMLKANGVSLDDDQIRKVTDPDGSLLEVLEIAAAHTGGDENISKYIKQLDFTTDIDEGLALLQHIDREFSMATGLYEFLYNGQAQVQDRSAAATHARQQNSETRIYDMQTRIEEFGSRVGRKMAMTARYLLDPSDVEPMLGKEQAQLWGNLFTQEQLTEDYWARRYMSVGMPPMDAMELASNTIQGGTTLEQWIYEVDYQVEPGSTARKTPEREAEALDKSTNTVLPTLLQMGATQSAFAILKAMGTNLGLPLEVMSTMQQELQQISESMQQQQAQQAEMQEAQMAQEDERMQMDMQDKEANREVEMLKAMMQAEAKAQGNANV